MLCLWMSWFLFLGGLGNYNLWFFLLCRNSPGWRYPLWFCNIEQPTWAFLRFVLNGGGFHLPRILIINILLILILGMRVGVGKGFAFLRFSTRKSIPSFFFIKEVADPSRQGVIQQCWLPHKILIDHGSFPLNRIYMEFILVNVWWFLKIYKKNNLPTPLKLLFRMYENTFAVIDKSFDVIF